MTQRRRRLNVAIAGGGIGGLAVALALRHRGHTARVFERAPAIREVGAGITISVNAMDALRRLGLERAVYRVGWRLDRADLRSWDGRPLTDLHLAAMEAQAGVPSVGIHRAALQRLLLDAAGAEVVTGCPVTGFELEGDGVRVETTGGLHDADLLVGADGIGSVVRAHLQGDRPARYAGYTCWRGIADLGPASVGVHGFFEAWGDGERFGGIPIAADRFSWYVAADAAAGGSEVDLAALRRRFSTWAAPVPGLLAATAPETILRNDIADRPFDPRWGTGPVTLVGDAAHAMTPNMGQGASQALEDALVLADRLERDDVEPALRAYEVARRTRTRALVAASWHLGRFAQRATVYRDHAMRAAPAALVRRAVCAAARPTRTRTESTAVRRIVEAACTAPSGDNCQPFDFSWDGARLTVQFDPVRARHRLDAGRNASRVALGCTLEAISVAASDEGLRARFEAAAALCFQVRFEPGGEPDALAAALAGRCTDRRPFAPGTLPAPVRADLRDDAAAEADIQLRLVPGDSELRAFALSTDAVLWRDPACMRDAARWVRYSAAEAARSGDGLPWRSLGYPPLEALGGRLVRAVPSSVGLLRRAGGPWRTRSHMRRLLEATPLFGCVFTTRAAPGAVVSAGRVAMRAWLRLNAAGWGFQPLSLPSLCVYNAATGALPDDLDPSLRALLGEGRATIGAAFGTEAVPVWMFRTGPTTPLPRAHVAPRRPIDRVFRDLS